MLQIYQVYENEYAKDFVRLFMQNDNGYKKVIFGTNNLAEELSKYVPVDLYVNTYTKEKSFMGKPLLHSMDEIPENALVLSTVYLGSIIIIMRRLSEYRFRSLDCYSFIQAAKFSVELFHFTSWKEDIINNREKYNRIFEMLSDEKSKNTFQNLVNFKFSGNIRYLEGFNPPTDEQYFDDCLELPKNPVFADIGGYDGLTSLKFIEHYPDYKKILFFEPEEKNLNLAKKNLSDFKNIQFIQKGLSDKNAVLHFSVNDSASMISDDGESSIEVMRLDDIAENVKDCEINFLKMDIEGAEGGGDCRCKKNHSNMASLHGNLCLS